MVSYVTDTSLFNVISLAQISWNLISRITKIITTCLFVAFDLWISVWFRLVLFRNWCLVMHATVFQVFYDFIETLIPTNILEHPNISSSPIISPWTQWRFVYRNSDGITLCFILFPPWGLWCELINDYLIILWFLYKLGGLKKHLNGVLIERIMSP